MSSVTLLLPLTLPCFRSLWWGYIWVWKTDLRGQSDHLTVNHAGVSAAVCLNQLSVDGSIHQLKLQLIWSRVSVAHGQLLTAYAHQQEERWSRLQTHTHTHTTQHCPVLNIVSYTNNFSDLSSWNVCILLLPMGACPPMLTSSTGSRTWNRGGCWWLDRSRTAKSISGVVCSPSDTSTQEQEGPWKQTTSAKWGK